MSWLWIVAVVLGVLWLLGLVSGATFGGWIYTLLVLAVIVAVLQLVLGRRAV